MIKDVMIVMGSLGFYFDMDRCIGCKTCQIACKEHNKLPVGEFFRRAGTFTCGTPSGEVRFNYSGACNHCARPAWVAACPTGAMYRAEVPVFSFDQGPALARFLASRRADFLLPVRG